MGNNKKSRRNFFSMMWSSTKPEKIKMLTQDGKLVEVDKSVFDALNSKKKATNLDIYKWMDNPSKKHQ
jgi:hypothetical protein